MLLLQPLLLLVAALLDIVRILGIVNTSDPQIPLVHRSVVVASVHHSVVSASVVAAASAALAGCCCHLVTMDLIVEVDRHRRHHLLAAFYEG